MKTFRFSLKKMVPLLLSYYFCGIAFGILLHNAGYSPFWAVISGLFVYSGSMQIVMVSFLTAGTPLWMVAVMSFFFSARHMFYGIGFIDEFRNIGKQPRFFWKYPYMAITLTDETYSILCTLEYPEDVDKQKAEFYILFLSHMWWLISCACGALAGELIPFDMTGVEFAATAFFVAAAVDQWRQFGSHLPVAVGVISAIAFYFIFGAENFILPALAVSMIALVMMKDKIMLKTGGAAHE